MLNFSLGFILAVWLIVGFVFMLLAGLTWKFKERHFDPAWMMLLGPLGYVAWRICEKREEKARERKD